MAHNPNFVLTNRYGCVSYAAMGGSFELPQVTILTLKKLEVNGAASGNRTHDIQNHNLAF